MESFRLDADEIACVKQLAERFARNETRIDCRARDESEDEPGCLVDPLGLPAEKREAILSVMEDMGVIVEADHADGYRFFRYGIAPKVIQVARAICEQENKKEEPRDIVEEVKTAVRSKPVMAWVIIGFFALAALITTINQLLQLLKTLGWLKGG